jgi:adenylate kinase family enzyme
MHRFVVFGNSGSGKSTLAKALSAQHQAPHLDLDVIAWRANEPGVRAAFAESQSALLKFIEASENWVIEGCYTGLLEVASVYCTELIFLNPGIEACVANCQARPWEPHKYPSPAAQDANLRMLLDWVREYATREDEFSLQEHRKLYAAHPGKKSEYQSNDEAAFRVQAVPPQTG